MLSVVSTYIKTNQKQIVKDSITTTIATLCAAFVLFLGDSLWNYVFASEPRPTPSTEKYGLASQPTMPESEIIYSVHYYPKKDTINGVILFRFYNKENTNYDELPCRINLVHNSNLSDVPTVTTDAIDVNGARDRITPSNVNSLYTFTVKPVNKDDKPFLAVTFHTSQIQYAQFNVDVPKSGVRLRCFEMNSRASEGRLSIANYMQKYIWNKAILRQNERYEPQMKAFIQPREYDTNYSPLRMRDNEWHSFALAPEMQYNILTEEDSIYFTYLLEQYYDSSRYHLNKPVPQPNKAEASKDSFIGLGIGYNKFSILGCSVIMMSYIGYLIFRTKKYV